MDLRIPVGHPVGWEVSEVPDKFFGSSVEFPQLQATLDGWGYTVEAEGDKLGVEY